MKLFSLGGRFHLWGQPEAGSPPPPVRRAEVGGRREGKGRGRHISVLGGGRKRLALKDLGLALSPQQLIRRIYSYTTAHGKQGHTLMPNCRQQTLLEAEHTPRGPSRIPEVGLRV